MDFSGSRKLQERFHAVIPGGAHTYAKGDDQFPEHMAPYLVRGKGCHVWDVDGNEFIEFGCGLRSVTLGHAHPAVVEAAAAQMHLRSNFVRPSALELEAAEELLSVIPGAEMVKFGKNGSDITSAALRLSRAYTGRGDLMTALGTYTPCFREIAALWPGPVLTVTPDGRRPLREDVGGIVAFIEKGPGL